MKGLELSRGYYEEYGVYNGGTAQGVTQEQYQHAVRRQNAAAATASPSERISALTLHQANIRSGGAGRYAVHW